MGGGPALKGLNSSWQVRPFLSVSTRARLHVALGLGIHDTSIEEKCVYFFCSECE